MSNKFSRNTKMQTAPAVCHTPPVPVPPTVPPWALELECFAVRRCSSGFCGVYAGTDCFDLMHRSGNPPGFYMFTNGWMDEPRDLTITVRLYSTDQLKTCNIDVNFRHSWPAANHNWEWKNVNARSQKPFYLPWKREMLPYPPLCDHQIQISITETGLHVFPPKEFSPFHPNVLPF